MYRFYEEIELFPKFSTIKNNEYIYTNDELIMIKFDYTREYNLELISVFDIINSKIDKHKKCRKNSEQFRFSEKIFQ